MHGDTALKGGSSFKGNFSVPFDGEALSHVLSNKWGVTADDIAGLWDMKGLVARNFGTAIHEILEDIGNGKQHNFKELWKCVYQSRDLYNEYKEVGAKICKKKRGCTENYAVPKHPDIKYFLFEGDKKKQQERMDLIVSEFTDMMQRKGFVGETVNEPLVTYEPYHMGGFIDRLLITGEKRCRVQDYKVSADIDKRDSNQKLHNEFKETEKTKVAGHALQLNYYAFCLHKAGWTVEGLDIFARDKGWAHYELDLYDMDWFEDIVRKYNMEEIKN